MNKIKTALCTLVITLVFKAQSQLPIFFYEVAPVQDEVVYIFAHGLGANRNQGTSLFMPQTTKKEWIIQEPCVTFDFPDAKAQEGLYDRKKVNLGQELDCQRLYEVYTKTRAQYPERKIVLIGISRGAATILMLEAQYKLEGVAAVVLESPFDTLSSIVEHLLKRFCLQWLPFADSLGHAVCQQHFPLVKPEGKFPIDVVSSVPKERPIFIVHSKMDRVIPINSSRKLYMHLVRHGNTNVHLLELNAGNHGKLILGSDYECYLFGIHAFYKKYGLPCDQTMADKGAYIFQTTTPPIVKVKERLNAKRSSSDDEQKPINESTMKILWSLWQKKIEMIFAI